ncbi:MAG: PilT protein domain-containing protein [Parcubacteria group bacterium Gr01-1014_70]|nr:MAG: PilT protein domain-containing protein [Parcubacteria group bacterium Gr01-1014_70]
MKYARNVLRAVLDTNILISAAVFSRSIPARVLRGALRGEFEFVTSLILLDELDAVLQRKKFPNFDTRTRLDFLRLLIKHAYVVDPQKQINAIMSDPSDNRVLEAAVEGHARYIVTGDRQHLLPLGTFRNIRIVPPRIFLEHLKRYHK